jgi:hypothetical protein
LWLSCAYYKVSYLHQQRWRVRGIVLRKATSKKTADSVDTKVFNLPIIRCRCGAEILLIPDAQATGKAIEQHIQNCRLVKQSTDRIKSADDLSDYLIKQVFDRALEAKQEEDRITEKQQ